MLNQSTIRQFVGSYQKHSELKHKLKTIADSIRMNAKQAIVLMRQEDFEGGVKKLKVAEQELKKARSFVSHESSLSEEGFYLDSLEEYVEAKAYHAFLTKSRLILPKFIKVGAEQAIGGLCDFTGELVRKTLAMADTNHIKEIQSFITITETIHTELSRTSFTGKLREKYDDLERNLSKLERVAYELRMKKE